MRNLFFILLLSLCLFSLSACMSLSSGGESTENEANEVEDDGSAEDNGAEDTAEETKNDEDALDESTNESVVGQDDEKSSNDERNAAETEDEPGGTTSETMSVAATIEKENITVYDPPNGSPIMFPDAWHLIKDADFESEDDWEFTYCFDLQMSEAIDGFEELIEADDGITNAPIERWNDDGNNKKGFVELEIDDFGVMWNLDVLFFVEEEGIFANNNCAIVTFYTN